MLQIEAIQDSSSALALSARVSVDLLLDDAPLGDEWTPADLSPEGWWRADLGHALSDSDPVTSWANQGTAGSTADLSQGTSTRQPTYDASHASFNDQAVIDFDGGDVLSAAASHWWDLASESSDMTLVVVARSTVSSGNNCTVGTQAYTAGGILQLLEVGGPIRSRVYESGGGADIADSGSNGVQSSVHVIASVLTGAVTTTPDDLETWTDGTGSGGTTGDLSAPVANSTDRAFNVGSYNTAATGSPLTGQLAEVVYVKRLISAAEDARLTSYLNERYGLSLTGVTQ